MTSSNTIRQGIDRRQDAWEAGELGILVEDITCACTYYLSTSKGEDTVDHRANIFHSLVLQGKLHSSV